MDPAPAPPLAGRVVQQAQEKQELLCLLGAALTLETKSSFLSLRKEQRRCPANTSKVGSPEESSAAAGLGPRQGAWTPGASHRA